MTAVKETSARLCPNLVAELKSNSLTLFHYKAVSTSSQLSTEGEWALLVLLKKAPALLLQMLLLISLKKVLALLLQMLLLIFLKRVQVLLPQLLLLRALKKVLALPPR